MPKLWTPDGMVRTEEKDVTLITRRELILLADLHEFADKHQIVIYCRRCEQPVRGQNNDSQKTAPSVCCQCREWRYVHA